MKLLKHLASAALVLVVCVGAATSQATASAPAKPARTYCTAVEATGAGVFDFATSTGTADIAVIRGLPVGTTFGGPFTFSATSDPDVVALSGPVVFTAKFREITLGTLTIATTGPFDTVSGEFTLAGPITGSTGILRGVTGTIKLSGVQNFIDGTFTETVTGTLCAPRR
jgi:hypothetical protein